MHLAHSTYIPDTPPTVAATPAPLHLSPADAPYVCREAAGRCLAALAGRCAREKVGKKINVFSRCVPLFLSELRRAPWEHYWELNGNTGG